MVAPHLSRFPTLPPKSSTVRPRHSGRPSARSKYWNCPTRDEMKVIELAPTTASWRARVPARDRPDAAPQPVPAAAGRRPSPRQPLSPARLAHPGDQPLVLGQPLLEALGRRRVAQLVVVVSIAAAREHDCVVWDRLPGVWRHVANRESDARPARLV